MFFIGIFGVGQKFQPAGQLPPARCPACGQQVAMHISCRYQYFHIFFIPLFKFGRQFLLSCPCCASVFAPGPQAGHIRHPQQIDPTQLCQVSAAKAAVCPACGHALQAGDRFCPHCGQPVSHQ